MEDRTCRSGKMPFRTWTVARRACHNLNKTESREHRYYAPYVCNLCGRIHIGGRGMGAKHIIAKKERRRSGDTRLRLHWRFLMDEAT